MSFLTIVDRLVTVIPSFQKMFFSVSEGFWEGVGNSLQVEMNLDTS